MKSEMTGERSLKVAARITTLMVVAVSIASLLYAQKADEKSSKRTVSADGVVEIVDGLRTWRFLPVDGISNLPLEFMMTGANKTNLVAVSMPKFWISDTMVTEEDFARLTGSRIRPNRKPGAPLCNVEWEDALDWCEQFTKKHAAKLPADAVVSMPTMIEWSHAVKTLEGKADLCGEVGTFLFTGNQYGGYLATLGKFNREDFDLAVDLLFVQKRMRQKVTGLRPVLVAWNGGATSVDGKKIDNTMVSRGGLLATVGYYNRAKVYLKKLIAEGGLSSEDREQAEKALAYAEESHDNDVEDWSGLVARAASFAKEKGYVVSPFAEAWQCFAALGSEKNSSVASAYGKYGIFGGFIRIGELPREVRSDQLLGETHGFVAFNKDKPAEEVEVSITTDTMVQALSCDFTGDGRKDLVVEQYGSVGSGGYWYNFYEKKADGCYTNVLDLQTVGLCALPSTSGKGCAFIHVAKESNPVLNVRFLRFVNGKPVFENANRKPIYMLDACEDRIYIAAPFIGAGFGLGWSYLEGQGVWYRPVFWPWKQGKVPSKAK